MILFQVYKEKKESKDQNVAKVNKERKVILSKRTVYDNKKSRFIKNKKQVDC